MHLEQELAGAACLVVSEHAEAGRLWQGTVLLRSVTTVTKDRQRDSLNVHKCVPSVVWALAMPPAPSVLGA